MAKEIQATYPTTASVLYAVIRNSVGQAYRQDTQAFETYATANLTTARYCVTMTEQGTASRYWSGDFPSAIAAGVYSVAVYVRAGGSPAEGDTLAAGGLIQWDGSAVVPLSSRLAPTVAGRTLDVSAGGEAGVDWANVGSPTTAVALTGTTVNAQLIPESLLVGLVAWYRNSGVDVSGRGNTATAIGSPTTTTGIGGDADGAMSSYGANQYTRNSLVNAGSFSLGLWVKPSVDGQGIGLYASGGLPPMTVGFQWGSDEGGYVQFLVDQSQYVEWTGTDIVDGQWHFVVGTYDGTTARLYHNGTLVASGAATASYASPVMKLGQADTATPFQNQFVYNRDLTAAEVSRLYRSGLSFDPTAVAAVDSVATNVTGKALGDNPASLVGTGVRADVRAWNGTAPNNLQSGRVDSYLAAAGLQTDAAEEIGTALLDLANGVESGKTLRQVMRIIAAVLAGQRTNTGTANEQFDALGSPGTARLVGNLDASGNGLPTVTP